MLVRSLRTGLRTSIRYSRIFTTARHQSTDATETTPEKEFKFPEVTLEYKEIFNEDLYKKLPITLANGKQIVTDLVNTIKNDTTIQSELDKIATIPTDQTSVYSKFSSLIDVLRRARSPFVQKSGLKGRGRLLNGVDVDADLSFRTSLGRWARRDEQLASELRDLYSYLSKRVFGVEMEYLLSDARCCGIHITAHKDAQRIICSDPDIVSANLKNPLLPSEFAQQVFKRESELLKLEEYELTKFNNKKTTIESEIAKFKDGGKVEDMLWKTDKDTWKTLTDFAADDTVSEDQVNTRFPKRLSTPEGWVRYKFQAMDVVYRYS